MTVVTVVPFETVFNQLEIEHFPGFFPPKVQIWVVLTPGPMDAIYPVSKMPLSKMGGQRGQNPYQITPRFFI